MRELQNPKQGFRKFLGKRGRQMGAIFASVYSEGDDSAAGFGAPFFFAKAFT